MKDKNKFGQYFTVDAVAAFMVNLIRHNKQAKVLEPSCGEGVFLKNLEKAGFTNIDAYEIDDTLNNPFKYVKYQSFVSSPLDKYDVVIGNPPYIRWKNLEQELKDELSSSRLWNKYFNSLCDYLFIFILKSIEQLNDNGELLFICTEYWMNTTNSSTLREYMLNNGYISEIYHFKEAPLFDGVCASFVIFRFIRTNNKPNTIKLYRYTQKGSPSLEQLLALTCFDEYEIPQFTLGERWLLATKEQQILLKNFEANCKKETCTLFSDDSNIYRIGEFCDIGNGMVSGLDKAFNITALENLTDIEKKSTIEVLKAKDLDYYTSISSSKYFFIKNRVSEEQFYNLYPNVSQHIKPFINDLNKRYNYGKDTPFWEFIFPRNQNLFERPEKRILVPCKERISNKNHFRFVLADPSYYPLQDVTGILKKPNCKESIEYLVAFLNNNRVFEWLGFNGIVKGYIVEFSEAPIASIPYRPINWSDPSEVEIHNKISGCVQQYCATRNPIFIEQIDNLFNTLFK